MNELQNLTSQINQASSILLFSPNKPGFDAVASTLSLYLVLKSAGKNVTVASNSEPIVRDSHLVGLDKIKTEIGQQNLVISFPYQEDSIEKVSYNVKNETFNLIIRPKQNHTPIKKDKLEFNYTGASADLVIILGCVQIQDVGNILIQEKDLLEQAKIVNISNKPSEFGDVNIVDTQASLSELTTALIQEINLQLTQDAAQNLLLGIEQATDNLQSQQITADTFEALATLYRAGANRSRNQKPKKSTAHPLKTKDQQNKIKKDEPESRPKPDWLKPKIYKSSSQNSSQN